MYLFGINLGLISIIGIAIVIKEQSFSMEQCDHNWLSKGAMAATLTSTMGLLGFFLEKF
jgi:hypothetical protein